jgi:transcription elongation factor Elf1
MTLAKEVRLRVDAVISAFRLLLDDIVTRLNGGSVKVASITLDKKKEKVLASTGKVWEACDALVQLDVLGVGGIIAQKVQQYQDTLKDAMEELKEWGEDVDDQDEGFVGSGDDEDDKDSIEELFGGSRLPAHRKDLKKLLEESLKKLKLVDMLFQALMKRRVKPFSSITMPSSDIFERLDSLCVKLKMIPEVVDELASTFYDFEAERAKVNLERIIEVAQELAREMRLSWTNAEDEFSKWLFRWEETVIKANDPGT